VDTRQAGNAAAPYTPARTARRVSTLAVIALVLGGIGVLALLLPLLWSYLPDQWPMMYLVIYFFGPLGGLFSSAAVVLAVIALTLSIKRRQRVVLPVIALVIGAAPFIIVIPLLGTLASLG